MKTIKRLMQIKEIQLVIERQKLLRLNIILDRLDDILTELKGGNKTNGKLRKVRK